MFYDFFIKQRTSCGEQNHTGITRDVISLQDKLLSLPLYERAASGEYYHSGYLFLPLKKVEYIKYKLL